MAQGEQEREDGDREAGQRDAERSNKMKGKTEIPGKDKHHGPDEFRKRVMEGLGSSSDPLLREAVKRYAEGLLK
jgi:hypothetical protein